MKSNNEILAIFHFYPWPKFQMSANNPRKSMSRQLKYVWVEFWKIALFLLHFFKSVYSVSLPFKAMKRERRIFVIKSNFRTSRTDIIMSFTEPKSIIKRSRHIGVAGYFKKKKRRIFIQAPCCRLSWTMNVAASVARFQHVFLWWVMPTSFVWCNVLYIQKCLWWARNYTNHIHIIVKYLFYNFYFFIHCLGLETR